MAKYMIHTCKDRHWYVKEYLVPSIIKTGIRPSDVIIWLDKKELGCLESCMSAFLYTQNYKYGDSDGVWHLQDDVIICKDFKELTEKYDSGVVCGYCWSEDRYSNLTGYVEPKRMWYSFPCIRIPNDIAVACGEWFYKDVIHNYQYHQWVTAKKYDDSIFKIYMMDYTLELATNLKPNLVDHIDFLIGGSVVNQTRSFSETRAQYFEDRYLVDELKEKLIKDGKLI